jgi:2-polyprenyl-3-methyl-5-hydroxy-6-metoxy-1,4-benzoquinol methylase
MKCKICKNTTENILSKIKNIYDEKLYEIHNCKFCNISFTKIEKKVSSNDIYKNNYDYDINTIIKKEKKWRINKNYSKIKNLINLNSESLVLDIGCMHGYFLNYLNTFYDCNCDGLEIDSFDNNAFKFNKINIYKEDLFKYSGKINNLNKYDFIILNHSLEHFDDPIMVIDSIFKLLKPNGFCYIVVPNFKSKISYLTRKCWGWLQPSVHYYHYNPSGLTKLFEKRNFKVYFNSNQGGDSIFIFLTLYNLLSYAFNLKLKIQKNSYLKKITIKLSSLFMKYVYYIGDDESLLLFKKR